MPRNKVIDTSQEASKGGAAEKWWSRNGMQAYYKGMRPNLSMPSKYKDNESNVFQVRKDYNLRDIGFGNWVTMEDRINYVNSLIIALLDFDKYILKFKKDVGFGALTITYGQRGKKGALAHYEPANHFINISRYKEGKEDKTIRFLATGGIQSLAHEYAHFLDFYGGQYLNKNSRIYALSGGVTIFKDKYKVNGNLRSIMDEILNTLIFTKNGKLSAYYQTILDEKKFSNGYKSYLLSRVELFARAFETFVYYELKKKKVSNYFLTHTSYKSITYPNRNLYLKYAPMMRRFLAEYRKFI